MKVPEILLSGHHAKIAAWKKEEGRRRTAQNPYRPAHPNTKAVVQKLPYATHT